MFVAAVTAVLVLYLIVSCLGALAFADLDGILR